ncbi:hypothetical protein [Vibrio maerlii]|uniref:hypothetical protein n=1 Tax=Vibrio maerlii TaxID=2231648 RepID=UPI001F13667D|nr:hypothetical protein [Vibrio maerlii]
MLPTVLRQGPCILASQSTVNKGESLDSRLPTLTYNKGDNLSKTSIAELTKVIGKKKWDELAKLYL